MALQFGPEQVGSVFEVGALSLVSVEQVVAGQFGDEGALIAGEAERSPRDCFVDELGIFE